MTHLHIEFQDSSYQLKVLESNHKIKQPQEKCRASTVILVTATKAKHRHQFHRRRRDQVCTRESRYLRVPLEKIPQSMIIIIN